MTPVRLEPAALRSRVKHSTTELLRSHHKREFLRRFPETDENPGSPHYVRDLFHALTIRENSLEDSGKQVRILAALSMVKVPLPYLPCEIIHEKILRNW